MGERNSREESDGGELAVETHTVRLLQLVDVFVKGSGFENKIVLVPKNIKLSC